MYFVIVTELGIVVSQNNTVSKSFAFDNSAAEFVEAKKGNLKNNSIINYLRELNAGFFISDDALLKVLKKESLDVQIMDEKQLDEIQANKPQVLVDAGFAKNVGDAMSKLRDFALSLSASRVTEVSQSPDLHIIQAINALDEMDVMINGLSSRLREWYGLHFPELDNIIDSINGYAQIVMAGNRSSLSERVYQDAGFPDSKVQMLSVIQQKSKGGDISPENLAIVQSIAKQILDMAKARNAIESHIESQMKSIAPNVSAILGTAVGARICESREHQEIGNTSCKHHSGSWRRKGSISGTKDRNTTTKARNFVPTPNSSRSTTMAARQDGSSHRIKGSNCCTR